MNFKTIRANALLLFIAIVWGVSFVAQDSAGEKLAQGTFIINCSRFFIGGLAVLPIALITNKKEHSRSEGAPTKITVICGILCGISLFAASGLQQYGMILGTPAGKSGFLTAMYVVFVPIIGLFMKKRISLPCLFAVILAPVGLYMLCIKNDFSMSVSDIVVIGCAVCYSAQIMLIDSFTKKCNPWLMSSVQFLTVSVLAGACMLIFEREYIGEIVKIIPEVLYLGIFSSGVGYTLQMVAQKDTNPTVASLLMSLESVFALLSSIIILGTKPTVREWIGCGIMFMVIVLSQIPTRKANE